MTNWVNEFLRVPRADDMNTQTAVQLGQKRIMIESVCVYVHVQLCVELIPDDSLQTDRTAWLCV